MQSMYSIGLDVHKRKISYCVKDGGTGLHFPIIMSISHLTYIKLRRKVTLVTPRRFSWFFLMTFRTIFVGSPASLANTNFPCATTGRLGVRSIL
jgi:hypothetical protein